MEKNNIDLHIHTVCSDGELTIIDILKKAEKLNLKYISITDHENCLAYEQIKNKDISKIYTGILIHGCELMACYNNKMIEILGYGVDERVINEWFEKNYSKQEIEKRDKRLFEILINNIKKTNLKFDFSIGLPEEIPYSGYFKFLVYNEIKKYTENEKFLEKYEINDYEKFIRYGLSNEKCELFINEGQVIASANEIIKLIHSAGGLAFIAHVYKYKLEDEIKFIEELIPLGLDGVECNYTTFSEEQTNKLIEFCKKKNLYKSGGSDFHGILKKNAKLGIGTKGKVINKNIIENWLKKINN